MPRRGIFEETRKDARKEDLGARVQGDITSYAARAFEKSRSKLARLHLEVLGYSRSVSDADTISYAVLGEELTRKYLIAKRDA